MRYIEYIESTGTQGIDCDFTPSGTNVKYICTFADFIKPTSDWAYVFGGYRPDGYGGIRSGGLTAGANIYNGNLVVGIGNGEQFIDANPPVNGKHTYTVTISGYNVSLNVDGEEYNTTFSGGINCPVAVCAAAGNGGLNQFGKVKIYAFQIYENDELVRDFVPALNDGEAGLYDRVTEVFFTNSGTGEFLYPKWVVTPEGLVNPDMPPIAETCIAAPYPAQYWRTERGTLTHALLPGYSYEEGAFKYAELLTRISIPDGVESIGAESFRYSGLKKVSLPENCSYSTDSFPENCEVTVRGEYGQLTGPDGREVLDCFGRRLYVRRNDNG